MLRHRRHYQGIKRLSCYRPLTALLAVPVIVVIAAISPSAARPIATKQTKAAQAEAAIIPDQLLKQGAALYQDNRPTEALQAWQQALVAYQNSGNRKGEGQASGNIGIAYRALGQYAIAIDYYQQALVISQDLNLPHQERRTLGNLGNVYAIIGQYDRALEYQISSRDIARSLQDKAGERVALTNLGATYASIGDYSAAINHYQESLDLLQTLNQQGAEAFVLCNLGSAYNIWQKEHAIAVDYYQRCLNLAQTIGHRFLEAEAFSGLGFAHEGLQAFEQAMAYYDQGEAIFSAMDDAQALATTLNNRAHTLMAWSQLQHEKGRAEMLATAEQNLRQAVTALSSLRTSLVADADRVSLFDTQVATYNLLQQVLIAQGKPEAALVASEEGRSRAFATLLQEKHSQSAAAFTLADIKQFAQQQNATLVEYSIVPDDNFIHQGKARGSATELYIWVVSPDGNIDFRSVDLSAKALNLTDSVTSSLAAVGTRSRGFRPAAESHDSTYIEQLQALHEILIAPISDLLPRDPSAPVIVAAQGELFSVPFPALVDKDETYLIENHTLLTTPSFQVLHLSQSARKSQPPTVMSSLQGDDFLIVGNPDMPEVWDVVSRQTQQLPNLPGAQTEAETVARLLGSEPLLNNNASERAVSQRMNSARVIHLATHGLLEYGSPEASGVSDMPGAIALTADDEYDGLLTTAEISALALSADLVVLSACDTGLGEITGDGVIGLSRSLMGAGAANVVVSLWSIPDAPTAVLMTEFYQQLRQGESKAQALRQAMLATKQDYPEPSSWAAFTLIGKAN